MGNHPIATAGGAPLADRLTYAVAAGHLAQEGPGFADWLALWRAQFTHWHDPVRSLVCQHAKGGDAARPTYQLIYTSHSMAPFARDLGHEGPPFAWDKDRRLVLAAYDELMAQGMRPRTEGYR